MMISQEPVSGRGVRAWLAAVCLTTAAGCSFGGTDEVVDNTCSVSADCDSSSHCLDGVCVKNGSTELTFSLEVTPNHVPDGSPPIPMSLGPFLLDGRSRTFDLPLPVTTTGKVFTMDKTGAVVPIAAALHFTPTETPEGQSPKTITATTTDSSDLSVELLGGVTYHVTIEPVDTSQAPYALDFTAKQGARLSVDYSKVKWTAQRYVIEGLQDRKLAIRALDAESGEVLSNTVQVTADGVSLQFPPKYGTYRLEISATTSYAKDSAGAGPDCDLTTPGFPVLSVDESVLRQDEAGTNVLALPEIPARVMYSGTVQLCSGSSMSNLAGMPMALEAQTLTLGTQADAVQARYNATTTVTQDPSSGALKFCTSVLPGDYVVVVTPPTNAECEIFAEQRHIDAASTDDTLKLRAPALLRGTIETADRMPLEQASVEAHALGVEIVLPDDNDPSIPSYNRSAQTTSDEAGDFRLPLDLGSYDIIVKPPVDSGFAWQVLYDVDIDTRSRNFVAGVILDTPVPVRGTLRYPGENRDAQRSLAGAEVHVYTQMPSGMRSVEIGRGIADEDGKIVLFIAPTLRKGL